MIKPDCAPHLHPNPPQPMLCEALTRSFYITAKDDIVEVTNIHSDNITVRPWQSLATADINTSVVRRTIICDQPAYSTTVQALEIQAIAQCDSITTSENRLATIVRGIRPVNIAKVVPSLFQKRSDIAFFTDGGYRSVPLSEEQITPFQTSHWWNSYCGQHQQEGDLNVHS